MRYTPERMSRIAIVFTVFLAFIAPAVRAGQVTFVVSFDQSVRAEPATGRLVIYLHKASLRDHGTPANGFVEENPQPLFGVDVKDLKPGESITIDDSATS